MSKRIFADNGQNQRSEGISQDELVEKSQKDVPDALAQKFQIFFSGRNLFIVLSESSVPVNRS